jgi:hypothetical protein
MSGFRARARTLHVATEIVPPICGVIDLALRKSGLIVELIEIWGHALKMPHHPPPSIR